MGFEGGQMPLYRRLPKRGFKNFQADYKKSLRLSDLSLIEESTITIETLKRNNLIPGYVNSVRIYLSTNTTLNKSILLQGIIATKGVKQLVQVDTV